MRRPALVSAVRAGSTSCSSPMPSPWQKASTSPPAGHPPPGSSASSASNPVGTAAAPGAAGAPPRQTDCRWRRSAKGVTVLYFYTVSGGLASPSLASTPEACGQVVPSNLVIGSDLDRLSVRRFRLRRRLQLVQH